MQVITRTATDFGSSARGDRKASERKLWKVGARARNAYETKRAGPRDYFRVVQGSMVQGRGLECLGQPARLQGSGPWTCSGHSAASENRAALPFQQRGGAVKALSPKARPFCDRQVVPTEGGLRGSLLHAVPVP